MDGLGRQVLAYYSEAYLPNQSSFFHTTYLSAILYPKQTNNIRVLYIMPLGMLWVTTASDRGCVLGFEGIVCWVFTKKTIQETTR